MGEYSSENGKKIFLQAKIITTNNVCLKMSYDKSKGCVIGAKREQRHSPVNDVPLRILRLYSILG